MRDAPEVLVIGGGPAGSVAATLLADTGHRVLVLERFPHIGESLLSAKAPILDAIGLTPAIERHGFFRKPGGTFLWGRQRASRGASGSARTRAGGAPCLSGGARRVRISA